MPRPLQLSMCTGCILEIARADVTASDWRRGKGKSGREGGCRRERARRIPWRRAAGARISLLRLQESVSASHCAWKPTPECRSRREPHGHISPSDNDSGEDRGSKESKLLFIFFNFIFFKLIPSFPSFPHLLQMKSVLGRGVAGTSH